MRNACFAGVSPALCFGPGYRCKSSCRRASAGGLYALSPTQKKSIQIPFTTKCTKDKSQRPQGVVFLVAFVPTIVCFVFKCVLYSSWFRQTIPSKPSLPFGFAKGDSALISTAIAVNSGLAFRTRVAGAPHVLGRCSFSYFRNTCYS